MTEKEYTSRIRYQRQTDLKCFVIKTYFNGDSTPFSAIALIALSNGSCTFAQAKSNSVRLCAHFEAINSNPDLHNA